MQDGDVLASPVCARRAVLAAGLAVAPWLITPARAQDDPTSLPPQPGDRLIFLTGPKKGQPVHVEDLTLGGPQEQAYPGDANGTVRDGSRLNLLIVLRIGTDGLDPDTLKHSADGVVAYSGVCTHQACPVNAWSEDLHAFVCSCHGSTYDPKASATVMFGPAPQSLAALPLKSDNGLLTVAAGFTLPVGMQPT